MKSARTRTSPIVVVVVILVGVYRGHLLLLLLLLTNGIMKIHRLPTSATIVMIRVKGPTKEQVLTLEKISFLNRKSIVLSEPDILILNTMNETVEFLQLSLENIIISLELILLLQPLRTTVLGITSILERPPLLLELRDELSGVAMELLVEVTDGEVEEFLV
jgi:hypothetical protein